MQLREQHAAHTSHVLLQKKCRRRPQWRVAGLHCRPSICAQQAVTPARPRVRNSVRQVRQGRRAQGVMAPSTWGGRWQCSGHRESLAAAPIAPSIPRAYWRQASRSRARPMHAYRASTESLEEYCRRRLFTQGKGRRSARSTSSTPAMILRGSLREVCRSAPAQTRRDCCLRESLDCISEEA